MARPREEVRNDMLQIGLDVSVNERIGKLVVNDWYSATLGLEKAGSPKETVETVQTESGSYTLVHSLRISDLSVQWLKDMKESISQPQPGALIIVESISPVMRFNEEKPYLEWHETRVNPNERRAQRIVLRGLARGTHSELFYRRMEGAADGVIELRVMEREEKIKNMIRARGFRREPHDTGWHEIEIKPNGEVIVTT
jgi:KaiC/GvpD/RAD55 family RecA-like ATPase